MCFNNWRVVWNIFLSPKLVADLQQDLRKMLSGGEKYILRNLSQILNTKFKKSLLLQQKSTDNDRKTRQNLDFWQNGERSCEIKPIGTAASEKFSLPTLKPAFRKKRV